MKRKISVSIDEEKLSALQKLLEEGLFPYLLRLSLRSAALRVNQNRDRPRDVGRLALADRASPRVGHHK